MWFPDRLRATLWRCRIMVWLAAWLVPRAERALWRSNQQRRFWHWCHFLSESGQFTPQNRLAIARACWLLFPDAFWLRFDREKSSKRVRAFLGSPVGLIFGLLLLAALLVTSTGIVPAAKSAFSPPFAEADRVVLITLDGNGINGKFSRTRSDTLLDLTTIWGKTHWADGFAPFSWGPGTLLLPSRDLPVGTARVGPEFFSTLRVKAALGRTLSAEDTRNCPECVVLSYALWHHEFHADPKIVGKQVFLNGNQRTVVGILPAEFHLISSGVEIWDSSMPPNCLRTLRGASERWRVFATAPHRRFCSTILPISRKVPDTFILLLKFRSLLLKRRFVGTFSRRSNSCY